MAKYLKQAGFSVDIYAVELGNSKDLASAVQEAQQAGLQPYSHFDFQSECEVYIDALFGIGLNRQLDFNWQNVIQTINQQTGLKISIDIPSRLDANTGQPLPVAIKADYTFTGLGLKAGLFTGQGKEYAGKIELISAIPTDTELQPIACLSSHQIQLPKREAFGHKGSYGHVLVVGGHADMGGAVIMAAEAAFAAGAGKVTIVCDAKHHLELCRVHQISCCVISILLNSGATPSTLSQVDAVCFGMGLGRDSWSEQQYTAWFELTQQSDLEVVSDADALWFLAKQPQVLNSQTYATPHPGEAATLLACSTAEVEMDRISAIHALQQKYQGQWVLKGSGSLILEERLYICNAGNAGMGTGGMGDVLAGMIASLKAQFAQKIYLHEIVTLHALGR